MIDQIHVYNTMNDAVNKALKEAYGTNREQPSPAQLAVGLLQMSMRYFVLAKMPDGSPTPKSVIRQFVSDLLGPDEVKPRDLRVVPNVKKG